MAVIEKTGTYVDGAGAYWFYKAGDVAPDGLRPAEIAGEVKKHGAPENRADAPQNTREKAAEKAAEPRSPRAGR